MDELTGPDPDLVLPAPRAADRVGRDTAMLTGLNLVSRLTGFVRVVAMAAAFGIGALGDTYQRANLVSNILFELLAGGLLFSVLVPTFVGLLDNGRRDDARALGGALLARALAVLAVVVVLGAAGGSWLMRALTASVPDGPGRDLQVDLGAFLLWFVMPQLLLYAVGAVTTAMLQADRRYVAAAVAPICNNLVVTATMVAFALMHDADQGLALTTPEKVLLGAGTLAGTLAMTAVPVLAARRARLDTPPRWNDPMAAGVGALARKGAWGAGDIGLNQVMMLATIVFAGRVSGGVIAYQTAFTFFLLPHAVLAHPIFTTLFPQLSTHGASGDMGAFARTVSGGLRAMVLLLAPAAALLAATAMPLLTVVSIGRVDERGAELVASVLAAYTAGLVGYSAFFLLTRASYALDDVRSPTMVYLWCTLAAVVSMGLSGGVLEGDAQVVVLGLIHAAAVTAGSIGLFRRLHRRAGEPLPVLSAVVRALVGAVLAGGAAWVVVRAVGWDGRATALAALTGAGLLGTLVYGLALVAMRTPELVPVRTWIAARAGRSGAAP